MEFKNIVIRKFLKEDKNKFKDFLELVKDDFIPPLSQEEINYYLDKLIQQKIVFL